MALLKDPTAIPRRGPFSKRERMARAESLGEITKYDPLAEAASALERAMGKTLDDDGDEPEAPLVALAAPETGDSGESVPEPESEVSAPQGGDNSYNLAEVNTKRKLGKFGHSRELRVSPRHMVMVLNAFLSPSGSCIEGYETATKIDDHRVELTLQRNMHDPCQREVITIPEAFLVSSYRTV